MMLTGCLHLIFAYRAGRNVWTEEQNMMKLVKGVIHCRTEKSAEEEGKREL